MGDRGRKHGFTLIEILVVIAIIAILAAIIFPVFVSAKDKAYQSKCASNLRQLGDAALMFAQDHDGFVPAFLNARVARDNGQWESGLLHNALDPYAKNNAIWFCPRDTYAGKDTVVWDVHHLYSSYWFRGLISVKDTGDTQGEGGETPAASCPLFSDPNASAFVPPNGANASAAESALHSGGINICFLDGHVKWEPRPVPYKPATK